MASESALRKECLDWIESWKSVIACGGATGYGEQVPGADTKQQSKESAGWNKEKDEWDD